MKEVTLPTDIEVFGHSVPSFPNGIEKAFQDLITKVDGGFSRSFFGICLMADDRIVYSAMAETKNSNERDNEAFVHQKIEKGTYLTTEIKNWRSKTGVINETFHELLQHPQAESNKPSIEWYQNEQKMLCMIKKRT